MSFSDVFINISFLVKIYFANKTRILMEMKLFKNMKNMQLFENRICFNWKFIVIFYFNSTDIITDSKNWMNAILHEFATLSLTRLKKIKRKNEKKRKRRNEETRPDWGRLRPRTAWWSGESWSPSVQGAEAKANPKWKLESRGWVEPKPCALATSTGYAGSTMNSKGKLPNSNF